MYFLSMSENEVFFYKIILFYKIFMKAIRSILYIFLLQFYLINLIDYVVIFNDIDFEENRKYLTS